MPISTRAWLNQIFRAKQARNGGIVRRKVSSVSKYASLDDLTAEVKRRNFHLLEVGGSYVIVCNPAKMTVHHHH